MISSLFLSCVLSTIWPGTIISFSNRLIQENQIVCTLLLARLSDSFWNLIWLVDLTARAFLPSIVMSQRKKLFIRQKKSVLLVVFFEALEFV